MATESCTHWRLWLWGLTQLTSPAPLQPWESTVTLSKLSPCLLQENRKSYFRFGHRQQGFHQKYLRGHLVLLIRSAESRGYFLPLLH